MPYWPRLSEESRARRISLWKINWITPILDPLREGKRFALPTIAISRRGKRYASSFHSLVSFGSEDIFLQILFSFLLVRCLHSSRETTQSTHSALFLLVAILALNTRSLNASQDQASKLAIVKLQEKRRPGAKPDA